MRLYLNGHDFAYELENVLRAFVREVEVARGRPGRGEEDYAYLRLARRGGACRLLCRVRWKGAEYVRGALKDGGASKGELERGLAGLLYDVMCTAVRRYPKWGIVTGVRPAKLAAAALRGGADSGRAAYSLSAEHRVSWEKADLAVRTAKKGAELAGYSGRDSFSLYISIPFCPSRCSYCSFVSKTVDRDRAIVGAYMNKLLAEIEAAGGIADRLGLRLESVYIGGGTPTILEVGQLAELCGAVSTYFRAANAREYTVEAGRPDTVTSGKLEALKRAGVTRISINPQTASDEVLREIGRGHTTGDVERAFAAAREAGFNAINSDLIAGLPRDSLAGFGSTLEWLLALAPENITLHTLTVKRASYLGERGYAPFGGAGEMIALAGPALEGAGYRPYYMYKQKGALDGLENTGYALPGTECLYNVFMMDELHTVLACGAGAVTKLVDQETGRIERIFNYKYPAEYIEGFERLAARKRGIESFYEDCV
jgi:oxygen-independent coproporphyrinogen-3 oxidase